MESRLKIYKMATSILLKFLTLKWNISRTIWRIEVGDCSFSCIFHALSFELNFFSTGGSPLSRPLLPAIALYTTQQNWKCLHIRNRQYTKFHISNIWSRRPLGENLDFSSPLGFDVQTNSDHKTQKLKLYSVSAFKTLSE